MGKKWLNSELEEDAAIASQEFWAQLSNDIESGTFWADRIKQVRNDPQRRLGIALENLPLPAAFREAAIAIRALIREKRKAKENYFHELALLYWLAAINSFSVPYSKVLQQPGYNVIESIPGKVIKTLPFSFKTLGYKKLELLNKTDVKWLKDAWGEPDIHTTMHALHKSVWEKYERKLKGNQKREVDELLSSFDDAKRPNSQNQLTSLNNIGKWISLFVIISMIILIFALLR